MKKALAILAMGLVPVAIVGLFVWWGNRAGTTWESGPPQPFGAATFAAGDDGGRLLFLLNREERDRSKARSIGPGTRQVYELRAHSVATLRPLWTTRLLTENGGHPAIGEMRLLALDGDRVWVFVREPVAISLADGAIVAGAASYVAPPPEPAPAQPKSWAEYDAIQARGDLETGSLAVKFRIAGGEFAGAWFGVLAEDEAAKFASRGTPPVLGDGDLGRSLYVASRGEDGRFGAPERVGDSTFLGAGLLREADSVEPLRTADPDGAFVLYRELTPDTATWRVARVDLAGESLFDVALPISEVEQLWRTDGAIAMVGPQQLAAGAHPDPHALLIALDPRDGAIRSADLETDPPATP